MVSALLSLVALLAVPQQAAKLGKRYPVRDLYLAVKPQGEVVKALLIAVTRLQWQRLVLDTGGQVHEGWGDFAEAKLDDLEKAGKGR